MLPVFVVRIVLMSDSDLSLDASRSPPSGNDMDAIDICQP